MRTTLYHVSFWTNDAGVALITFLTFWSMDALITWLAWRPSITQRAERPWLTLRMKTNTQTTNKPIFERVKNRSAVLSVACDILTISYFLIHFFMNFKNS